MEKKTPTPVHQPNVLGSIHENSSERNISDFSRSCDLHYSRPPLRGLSVNEFDVTMPATAMWKAATEVANWFCLEFFLRLHEIALQEVGPGALLQ